jgi:TonB family protein
MKRYDGKLAGIIGTIIIHLIVGILFVSVKLNSLKSELAKEFILIFEEPEPTPDKQTVDLLALKEAEMSETDMKIRNIVRNLANQENPVLDPKEYQDKVKEEMIKSGLLTEDNFIDDWQNRTSREKSDPVSVEERKEQIKAEEQKPENYQGPTRVYYNLPGRYHRHLPVPIYKCEGGGKVTVSIDVDPQGVVTDSRIVASESTTTDVCLIETAINAANSSRFNVSSSSPKKQPGTITFHFVAQ